MGEMIQTVVSQAADGGSMIEQLMKMAPMVIAMVGIFYFLMIRPERKRVTDHQTLLGSLKKGDEIVLTSGIIGKIQALDERTVTLELGEGPAANKTRVRVLKQAVTGLAARMLAAPEAPGSSDKKALEAPAKADDKAVEKSVDADDAKKMKTA